MQDFDSWETELYHHDTAVDASEAIGKCYGF